MASLFGANAFSTPVGQRIGIFQNKMYYLYTVLKFSTLSVLLEHIFSLHTEFVDTEVGGNSWIMPSVIDR